MLWLACYDPARSSFLNPMKISGSLTPEEYAETARLLQSKSYWPKFILRNFYGAGILIALTAGTISGLLHHTIPNWRSLGIIWVAILVIFAWSIWSVRRNTRKQIAQYNATGPEYFVIEADGLHAQSKTGGNSFQPWSAFSSVKDGKRVQLLMLPGNTVQILPISSLSLSEQESLRGKLRSLLASVESGR
ncbi:hypothetical protein [Silvibacterium dinghuense]|uniref:YcxB-like protein domain-containing protein n=1 Tax=Silvibacterium dinghuense TaxID=1560006 RepID=A0A4Q1SK81_9BACT|nr:hypothetical protein [Silvibacterium dinghuense]RXS97863.1 hypothetical protein ESZ00_08390 [Silvibacterium dinghuense]GGH02575.1 hypothetical protein GCM10011586_17980 [Silvibacterium dinghuense]